jgi:quercetin dioxygenase-like cupin family protein
MGAYTLRLCEDHLAETARLALTACPRVVYVLAGDVFVTAGGGRTHVPVDRAWHGAGGCSVAASARGATILRYELLRGASAADDTGAAAGVTTRLLISPLLSLDEAGEYLMRCDRVDFAPGGEALPHRHKGGGVRCLIIGELEVRIAARYGRVMKPGDAWFESGLEPVHAIASATLSTSFIRVSILPRVIRGQSSIMYVDPAHASVKPRKYTVFVDEPIALP